eukprot:2897938-Rhodomonas_salina.3
MCSAASTMCATAYSRSVLHTPLLRTGCRVGYCIQDAVHATAYRMSYALLHTGSQYRARGRKGHLVGEGDGGAVGGGGERRGVRRSSLAC